MPCSQLGCRNSRDASHQWLQWLRCSDADCTDGAAPHIASLANLILMPTRSCVSDTLARMPDGALGIVQFGLRQAANRRALVRRTASYVQAAFPQADPDKRGHQTLRGEKVKAHDSCGGGEDGHDDEVYVGCD